MRLRDLFRASSLAMMSAPSALAPAVLATERAPAVSPACPCAPASPPGARRHDGFFARAEVGVAVLDATLRAPGRSGAQAIGQSSMLSVGGTPARGFVVGGSIWAARLDPRFVEGANTVVPDDDSVKLTFARIGPFVSFYPDPLDGFHADLGLSLMLAVESDEKGDALEPGFAGPALSLGLGYEWFATSEFSLGVLGRMSFARVTRDAATGPERMLAESLELAISYTYH